jgi:hypothetical protein
VDAEVWMFLPCISKEQKGDEIRRKLHVDGLLETWMFLPGFFCRIMVVRILMLMQGGSDLSLLKENKIVHSGHYGEFKLSIQTKSEKPR